MTWCPVMGVLGELSLDLHDLTIVTLVCDDDESLLLTGLFFVRVNLSSGVSRFILLTRTRRVYILLVLWLFV